MYFKIYVVKHFHFSTFYTKIEYICYRIITTIIHLKIDKIKTLKDIEKLSNVSSVFATETKIEVNFINGFTTYSLSYWSLEEIYEDVKKQGNLL